MPEYQPTVATSLVACVSEVRAAAARLNILVFTDAELDIVASAIQSLERALADLKALCVEQLREELPKRDRKRPRKK